MGAFEGKLGRALLCLLLLVLLVVAALVMAAAAGIARPGILGGAPSAPPKVLVVQSDFYDTSELEAALGDEWTLRRYSKDERPAAGESPAEAGIFDTNILHLPHVWKWPLRSAVRLNARALTAKGTLLEMANGAARGACAAHMPRGEVIPNDLDAPPLLPAYMKGKMWVWRPEDNWGGKGVVFGRTQKQLAKAWLDHRTALRSAKLPRSASLAPERAVLTEYVPDTKLVEVGGEKRKFHVRVHLVLVVDGKRKTRSLWMAEGASFIRTSDAAFTDEPDFAAHDSHLGSTEAAINFPEEYPGTAAERKRALASIREAFACIAEAALPFVTMYRDDVRDGRVSGYEVLGADVMFGADDRAPGNNKAYVIEINSVPGFGESHRARSAPAILGVIARAVFGVETPMPAGTEAVKLGEVKGTGNPEALRFPWEKCSVRPRRDGQQDVLVNGSVVGLAKLRGSSWVIDLGRKWRERGIEEAAQRLLPSPRGKGRAGRK